MDVHSGEAASVETAMTELSKIKIDGIPHISELVQLRTWDEATGIYSTQTGFGVAVELLPFIGIAQADVAVLESMFSDIDLDRMTIQVVNWASGRIGERLQHWASGRRETGFREVRAEAFKAAAKGNYLSSQNWRPRHYRVFVFVHMTAGKMTFERKETLIRISERLQQNFTTLGTPCRSMKPQQLLALVTDIVAPATSLANVPEPVWNEGELLNEQVMAPGLEMRVDFKEISFTGEGQSLARCYTVKQLPAEWPGGASASLIGDIFRPASFCPMPVLQSMTLKKAAISQELVGMKAGQADKAARSPLRFLSPHSVKELEDFSDVTSAMAAGQTMVTIHYQLAVFAEPSSMDDTETQLRGLFERQGFNIVPEMGIQLPAFKAALPFGGHADSLAIMKRFARTRTVKLINAVTLMPLFGEWQGNDFKKPGLMLLAGRRGEVAAWTPFESNANYNVCIVGQSGQGKSVAMQEIMAALISVDGAVVVIDDGYSFMNSAAILGGSHVDFGSADLEINPFAAIDAEAAASDPDFAETAISMLVNFISALCHPGKEPSDMERAILTNVVDKCWREKATRARLDDVLSELRSISQKETGGKNEKNICDELVTLLAPFASVGTYGRIFAKGCSVRMNAALMVFEMSSLREKQHVQAAAMVLLIFLATQMMYNSPREKPVAIMVDEAWALLAGTTADFIEGVARRARKYNGSLITSTQGVDDYFRSTAAEAAWANSTWRIFLRMQDASIEALKKEKQIHCDETLLRGLRSLKSERDIWSELIIHGQSGWDITRLILDPVSLSAFSSTGEDVAAIQTLIKTGMSRAEAIVAHAQRRKTGETL